MNDETWDVVVVGGGAGGLSAALTLARSRRRVLVVDAGDPRNTPADGVHNYLGREGTPPGELTAIGRAEVEGYGGVVRSGRVVSAAVSEGGGFDLGLEAGETLHARRLVVATGVTDELPDLPGVRERWGRDVLHCPYCHGWEVRDRRIGVLATSPLALHQVQLLRQWSDDVVLLDNDAIELNHVAEGELSARGIEVVPGKVTGLVVGTALEGAELADGTTVRLDALAVAPVSRARAEVPTMLGVPVVEQWMGDVLVGDVVETQPGGATAVDGLWVVGNAADLRTVVIGAAAAGTAVAGAVNADLVAEDVRLAVNASRDGSPEFWERLYAAREQIWSGRVNATVGDVADPLEPGTALDLGAGEGGDALWLAERGWRVTAVDVSQTACDRIGDLAGDLPVTTERHDLTETFPEGSFDLVSASFLHSPNADFPRTTILRRAAEAVAPGGTLLVVGHGRLAPWSWDPSLRMSTAAEVLEGLALDDTWEVRRCESAERVATGPGGQEATITDEIVEVRRRR
ncbi:NAD(P)/FAD-dependent oxidoreductase [Actinomycetospora corticicola]|uniref:Thioredoxin reductase/SAM-dependent methyltransferase n=1 Tax=Actinomycetospora corticicola TaxID=663602 RepID=A0A7Y9J4R7_9PSEU|nr:bifunctional NAD(P)/FAD-dependent oxidoreductase/class I SAM-dependent methyltransferase [Actinomycetospora corticicola]NYD35320.1 thioredoxin reductase/SAM-dependent methyltransferase [Actinomycetospora corticicola]